ncbi:MAG TPA: CoA transferase [Candidatus Baltobacteraceae bacterium]|nr:CoA transferase [Candidatus Baltobacteraceae bacterium]
MLEGIRVVAIATNIPGPVAAARLHQLGASVVKVEPLRGDPLAHASPTWYETLTRGIAVERIDVRAPESAARIDAYLLDADLLLTAMRARALRNAGLDWPRLHARYPRLCCVSLTGEAPPNDDRAGHDLTYQARAGTIAPPAIPRALIGDMAAAERVVSVALALLLRRERNGEAGAANVAITDAATDFAQPYAHGLTRENGVLGGALPAYNIYPAREGWVAVAALEPHFVQRLLAMLEVEAVDAGALRAAFALRSAQEWEQLAQHHDVPLAAIR